ncbi:MAG: hypothetical protein V1658_00745, partial [Candidatus Micrarchaeota archaeon]
DISFFPAYEEGIFKIYPYCGYGGVVFARLIDYQFPKISTLSFLFFYQRIISDIQTVPFLCRIIMPGAA